MKNKFFTCVIFVLALAFHACTTTKMIKSFEQEMVITEIDFRKYAEQDFLISPRSYGGDFVTVAFISVIAKDGARQIHEIRKHTREYSVAHDKMIEEWSWELQPFTPEQVLDRVVEHAKKVGADGLVEFKFTREEETQTHGTLDGEVQRLLNPFSRGEFHLEAWAIKRK